MTYTIDHNKIREGLEELLKLKVNRVLDCTPQTENIDGIVCAYELVESFIEGQIGEVNIVPYRNQVDDHIDTLYNEVKVK